MPLPALVLAAAPVVAKGVQVAVSAGVGYMSYRYRKSKGQSEAQAIAGAGAEVVAGALVFPGLSGAGRVLGIAKAATAAQKIRRVGTGIALSAGATQYGGFQSDNLTGVNNINTLRETTYKQPMKPQGGPTATASSSTPSIPLASEAVDAPKNYFTPALYGAGALLGLGGLAIATRGRRGVKELVARAAVIPPVAAISQGAAKAAAGASEVAQGAASGAAAAAAKVAKEIPTPAAAAAKLGDLGVATSKALDRVDGLMAKGNLEDIWGAAGQAVRDINGNPLSKSASQAAATATAPVAQAAKAAAERVATTPVGRAFQNLLTNPKTKDLATAAQRTGQSLKDSVRRVAAAPVAPGAKPGFIQNMAQTAVQTFAPGALGKQFFGELAKSTVIAGGLRFLGVIGPRPVAAAAVAAPLAPIGLSALGILKQQNDSRYGTDAAAWDVFFLGGNANKVFGVPGFEHQRLAAQNRQSDSKNATAIALKKMEIEAGNQDANDRAQLALKIAQMRYGGGQGQGSNPGGQSYYGPALGPGNAKYTAPGAGFNQTSVAIRGQEVQREASQNTLKGVQAKVLGDVRTQEIRSSTDLAIQKDKGSTTRYVADTTVARQRIQTSGQLGVAKMQTRAQVAVADRVLAGVQVRAGADVKIAAGDQYTRRYGADRALDGKKVEAGASITRQQIQTSGQVKVADIGARAGIARQQIQTGGQIQIADIGARAGIARQQIQTGGQVDIQKIKTVGDIQIAQGAQYTQRYQADAANRNTQTLEDTKRYQADIGFRTQQDTNKTSIINEKTKADANLAGERAKAYATQASGQASAAAVIHAAALKADPERMMASGQELENLLKRREMASVFKAMRSQSPW